MSGIPECYTDEIAVRTIVNVAHDKSQDDKFSPSQNVGHASALAYRCCVAERVQLGWLLFASGNGTPEANERQAIYR